MYKRIYAIFFALIFIPLKAICSGQTPTIIVKDISINEHEFFEKYIVIGKCLAEKSRIYNSNVQGRVDYISALQGKIIKEGSILIAIDKELAEATKNEAETSYNSAISNYKRDRSLFQRKIISEETLNQSKVALEKSKVVLNKAIKTYNSMIIIAPFDGYIGVIKAKVGDEIKTGDYLFSLFSTSENSDTGKTLFVELPEKLLNKINERSEVHTIDLKGNKIQGKIIAISNYVSEQGTLNTKITFPSNAKLAYGSFVELEIIYNKHKGLALPEKAVLKNNEGNFVYKVEDNKKAKQIYVTLGTRTGEMIELVSRNLKLGEKIIVQGLTKVFDGADISPQLMMKKID